MARATKMGADLRTREAQRQQFSGHYCATCGKPITKGDLLMVTVMDFDENGRVRRGRQKIAYHRSGSCFKTG